MYEMGDTQALMDGASDVINQQTLNVHVQQVEKIKNLNEKLNFLKTNSQDSLQLKSSLIASQLSKQHCLDQFMSKEEKKEELMLLQKDKAAGLIIQCLEEKQACQNLLATYQKECECLAQKFTSAPLNFAVGKIQEDILQGNLGVEDLKNTILTEFLPEISTWDGLIRNEPTTSLEISGLPAKELSAKDLSILVHELEESTQQLNEDLELCIQEIDHLEEKEESL